jgi:formylmethanofuran dehydrogenase subunit E
METIILVASLMNLGVVSQEIHASDPGYSIHNYKHVNKASAVAKRDTNKGVRVSYDETSRDYKKTASKDSEKVLKIFRPIENKDYLVRKNYKMPNG